MLKKLFIWIGKYEQHLSAASMVAGFVFDTLFFGRVDLWRTQAVFASYTAVCFVSIALLHYLESRAARGRPKPRWRSLLPLATQFALGGFWSGFLILYSRSAVISASWPFLLVLFAIFIGNEYYRAYHDRLVFTSVLFFFALYSCAIFELPIYTGTIDVRTFLESGLAAILIFALFTILLRILGNARFKEEVWRIRAGALAVLLLINFFYFTNILPPLPLSATAAGVYHSVWRVPGSYLATAEDESWAARTLGFAPTLHAVQGESFSAYSSVFAPTTLATTIVHQWQWYDPSAGWWVTKASIQYPIVGGRDNGYRGYSTVLMTPPESGA